MSFDFHGKNVFIAGVSDDIGFGWTIAKHFKEAGARVYIGVWAPMIKIFTQSYEGGKWDTSRELSDGSLLTFDGIYPFDANYDTLSEVPTAIRESKRYKDLEGYTLSDLKAKLESDIGRIDVLAHCLANAPEIKNDLLDTSRDGYLSALNASSYSLIALLRHLGGMMPPGSSTFSLTYLAGSRVIPGYGGGMSSAKAALENDTRQLAWEGGRRWGIRVNTISAGPMRSRAAKAIGVIDKIITYSKANAPLQGEISADDVAASALFLSSEAARAITGVTLFVDHGMHAMGIAPQLTTHAAYDTNVEFAQSAQNGAAS